MLTQTIYELSQEAERLLQLALHNLQTLQSMPMAALDDPATQPGGDRVNIHPLHFSTRGIEAQKATLHNELRKVTRLEMVLAIVGTMKAGKSTTINAIVGTEVLPNRNRPMTALPTLIRHTLGQNEPILHFSHAGPIETLMHKLQEQLGKIDRETLAHRLEIDKDMVALLERIETGMAFERHYPGAQPIFHCLKSLNDLVRLSRALEVDFPFSDYAAIEHIPVIEVEFVHLSGLGNYPGQLTLLDTPGPNEAGQPHLQKMLNEQLAHVSAVLAVMDYTQLKSISDQEVHQAIVAVGKAVPLYALVNKFDQKDRNSDYADQVRALIAGTLMKGYITPERIFPVSSMWGYLANRARDELIMDGRLPDTGEQRWVQDFAEAALGRRWRLAALNRAEIRLDGESGRGQLVLDDESQAQVVLSKIRSACEMILLNAQQTLTQELELRFSQLETTLTRSLNDAMRPIETRLKNELSEAGFHTRISLPAFHPGVLNFTTPQLFNGVIAAEDLPLSAHSRVSSVRETVSRWLNNPNWGWDDYVVTRTRYIIDIASLSTARWIQEDAHLPRDDIQTLFSVEQA